MDDASCIKIGYRLRRLLQYLRGLRRRSKKSRYPKLATLKRMVKLASKSYARTNPGKPGKPTTMKDLVLETNVFDEPFERLDTAISIEASVRR